MPYKIGWHMPGRIISGSVEGIQTIEEMTETNKLTLSLLDEGTYPVHMILDDTRLKHTPINLKQLQNALAYVRHPSMGWIVLVGKNNPVLSILLSTLTSLMRAKVKRVETFEAALAFLQMRDNTLSPKYTGNIPVSS